MARLNRLLDPMRFGSDAEKLDAELHNRIIGQDEAVRHIVDAYQMFLAGLASPERPVANFLFLGPTGTGKTRLVEATAESLAGDPRAVIKIDCAEFQHSHEIAKLVGSPPGYLGHRETHPALSQEVLDKYQTDTLKLSFVLFDEIEKASDALWNLLLGILDKAILTLGDNRRVDFSRAMIFMTSNLGAREMMALADPKVGFAAGAPRPADLAGRIERAGVEAARRRFSPEFLNRIDKVVVFRALGDAELRRILDLELTAIGQRWSVASAAGPLSLALSDAAKEFLLEEGADLASGARHLKRAIERSLVHPMSNLVASAQVRAGDTITVDFDPRARTLLFYKEAEASPAAAAVAEAAAVAVGQTAALPAVLQERPARVQVIRRPQGRP
jgi:ATP-dependent Clp protease ATP-binding subunit ClpA